MSKQINRVNIEPELLRGNWSSYWKYNFFVNPFTSCKTDIIIVTITQYGSTVYIGIAMGCPAL